MVGTSVGFPWIFWVLSLGCLHYSYIEIMDYFSLFILFFPNILSCCFFFLKCLTFLNINLSPYISVFVSDTVCSDLLSWMANGFIQSLGTACGPTHLQHCPLHIMWPQCELLYKNTAFYHFVRNDFSVNQVLMKISETKIKVIL